ncbi:MAG: CooT family nickel-binding protein [Euryarchaeota archaeon]|nr:CooT family nickel-binding protein [Euryarchaeota archaeon]
MCESRLYLLEKGEKKKVMDEAILVKEEDGKVVAVAVLGERREFEGARIVEIDMDRHSITIARD